MGMSHADCDHPRTPKARAECRRQLKRQALQAQYAERPRKARTSTTRSKIIVRIGDADTGRLRCETCTEELELEGLSGRVVSAWQARHTQGRCDEPPPEIMGRRRRTRR